MDSQTERRFRFVKAARTEEVPQGTFKAVRLEEFDLILTNWEGSFYCFRNRCPHQHNSLEGAKVWDGMLECPWHHFRYNLRTGENLYPRNVYPQDEPRLQEQLHPLDPYPLRVIRGEILVGLPTSYPSDSP
ncbi:MAG: Rieske (2Fe-2S) protein [Acidobacteria bacterium]|nr:Rieske (2Fe-2S) protein [Acidobacteriota bacterium]